MGGQTLQSHDVRKGQLLHQVFEQGLTTAAGYDQQMFDLFLSNDGNHRDVYLLVV